MTWILWIAAGSVGSWVVAATVSPDLAAEVFYGMLGPFVAVSGSSILVERASRLNPRGVTSLMMTAFVVKMVFFALYVVAVFAIAGVDRVPFVMSFTGYFLALYVSQALLMRRWFARLT